MKSFFSHRHLNFYCFLITLMLIGGAFYFQIIEKIQPCPLCIFQRVVVGILMGLFLIGTFYSPGFWARKVYALLILLTSGIGMYFAGRQIYLQHLPPEQAPLCGPGLNMLVNKLPITEIMRMSLRGTGECAKVDWSFLNLSMAEWVFGFFVFFALVGFWQIVKK